MTQPKADGVPTKVKIAFLKGHQAAIKETCGKLNEQVFRVQEQINRLQDEEKAAP